MHGTAERNIEAHLRSAAKIEPDRLARLKLIGAEWAGAVAAALNATYAAPVEVEFAELSSFSFAPAAPQMAGAVLALLVTSSRWREIGFVLADDRLANTLVEAMFGGTGSLPPGPARPMTKLDRRFVEMGLETFVKAANPVFEPVAPLDMVPDKAIAEAIGPTLGDLLTIDNRAFLQLSFTVTVGRNKSTVRFALPERPLAPHRRKLTVVPEASPFVADEEWARDIQEGLQHADMEVRALLDERQISLGEVARFTLGQTIVLDATMDSLIVIECEEQRLFRGRMGHGRDSYVVRIEEKIDPTEEFIDDILSD